MGLAYAAIILPGIVVVACPPPFRRFVVFLLSTALALRRELVGPPCIGQAFNGLQLRLPVVVVIGTVGG